MFEQFGGFEQSSDFFLTQDNGEFLAPLDGGQFDPLVFHPFNPIGKPKGINSKLEVGIRRCIVTPLNQIQVIIDPVGIHLRGQFIEVNSQLGQMAAVVGDRALTFARNGNFLMKLGQ